jgi:hypothetical protein
LTEPTQIAHAIGLQPDKIGQVVQLAFEELHRITILDEEGLTATAMAAYFSLRA